MFDRNNAVKQSYKLAADVMHIDFIATGNANSQLQSLAGLFHNIRSFKNNYNLQFSVTLIWQDQI